eukprot:CAMPEP_0176109214 /NCGR_PEP_ID=MMETSP0120_2-20121206/54830_1 /TAXON_ID=160619 /ORGANISM="Kryptoperidinium foliaceum, Strain CCMP 1326" /LENGTH=134 /DNA_ID=CAMNT_0017443393 /DNA_START=47 /DNA_END=451 /DNA_ORIENTATION=+
MPAQSIGDVQQQLDATISTMRDNMQMMAERDFQLHDMAEKTEDFSTSATRFSQGATQLRRREDWRRRRVCIIVFILALLVAWLFVAYYLRDASCFREFLHFSVVVAVVLVVAGILVQRCLLRRNACANESPPAE